MEGSLKETSSINYDLNNKKELSLGKIGEMSILGGRKRYCSQGLKVKRLWEVQGIGRVSVWQKPSWKGEW